MSYKSIFLSILSAILLMLAFPKPGIGGLAWVALLPWFFALQKEKPVSAFFLSYLVGLVFFSGAVYWVNYVSGLGFTVLVFYLALYFAAFGLLFSTLIVTGRQSLMAGLFLGPCLWVALEYIRSHLFTGFSWALLGYSQYSALAVIQISDITGAYGVSFLLVLVNVGIYQAINRVQSRKYRVQKRVSLKKSLFSVLCPLISVIIVLAYGYVKLNQEFAGDNLKVSVVQGNIPQKMKWDPGARDYILERYFLLTEQAALAEPEMIIWPETSVPGYLEADSRTLKEVSSLSRKISPAYLLVGTPRAGETGQTYNSASLLAQGKIIRSYDKLHLVPFGEFTPWPEFFSRFSFAGLIGDFTPGEDYTVFTLPRREGKIKFSALICFEDVFGHFVRRFVQKGAQILVNMTNDAWFRDSSEPYQHLQASVFRAVENRVNVVRSANTGVSCFINPWGKILSRVCDDSGRDLLVAGEKTQRLQVVAMPSFYTAFGDIFAWLCVAVSAVFIIVRCFCSARLLR